MSTRRRARGSRSDRGHPNSNASAKESDRGRRRRRDRDSHKRKKAEDSEEMRSEKELEASASDSEDEDSQGKIRIKEGDFIKDRDGVRDRYRVLGLAGTGTFGTVLDVLDTHRNERVALKVVRSVPRYLEAASVEVDILDKIREADTNKDSLCVRLYSNFKIRHKSRKHVCLGFEKLGRSLYEFIKKNKYQGLNLEDVRAVGWQLLRSVSFCHSIKLIHTDLKPENILLVNSNYKLTTLNKKEFRTPLSNHVRLIDFGGATWENEHHSRIINTRQYRSPEVLLGLGWSYPSDLWSVGCILGEIFTGELLFGTHEDLEHLALIQKILGINIPDYIADAALEPYRKKKKKNGRRRHSDSDSSDDSSSRKSKKHSKRKRRRSTSQPRPDELLSLETGLLRWPEDASSDSSIRHVERAKTLENLIGDDDLVDLIRRLLTIDPEKRITAKEAMDHSFFDSITPGQKRAFSEPRKEMSNGELVSVRRRKSKSRSK